MHACVFLCVCGWVGVYEGEKEKEREAVYVCGYES